MATSAEVKAAADAVALAKVTRAAAQAAVDANEAIVVSLVTTEQAAFDAQVAVLADATNVARSSISGYQETIDALIAANDAAEVAILALRDATASYDGS